MKIGKTKLEVYTGGIGKADAVAVVNPANDMLWTGGGISAVLRKEGGKTIETEVMSKAPAAIGTAVLTGAGKLRYKRMIHAVISGQDLSTTEGNIRKAVRASLEKADEVRCSSIAIPLLDSGSFDVEIHVAAKAIVDETVSYLLEHRTGLARIVFVEHDRTMKGVFDTALHEKFTKH